MSDHLWSSTAACTQILGMGEHWQPLPQHTPHATHRQAPGTLPSSHFHIPSTVSDLQQS